MFSDEFIRKMIVLGKNMKGSFNIAINAAPGKRLSNKNLLTYEEVSYDDRFIDLLEVAALEMYISSRDCSAYDPI